MSIEGEAASKGFFRMVASQLRQEREKRAWTQREVAERIGTTQINVSRWENAITVPSPYYRQKLGELFGKSIQELGFVQENSEEHNEETSTSSFKPNPQDPSPPLPIWNVPYRRNPFFTGRESILAHLYTTFRRGKAKSLINIQAISGLGGIGKTQIAVEYVYRYGSVYQAVFWMTVSTRDALSADFAMLAELLGLPEQQARDQNIVLRAVKGHLENTNTRWLLILDNVDDLEVIIDFLPTQGIGDVLLTTRLHAMGTIAHSIEVEKMKQDEAVLFLLHRTKVITPDALLDQATEESLAQATEIVAALDGLPLALDQAGAYIEETRCSLSQYLNLYSVHRKHLLLRRGRFPTYHPDSVATTWSLSFQQVEQESLAAADLLRFLAFLNPETIPEEIITLGAAELGPSFGPVARDPLKIDTTIELLLHYSLIRRTPEIKSLSIHRLVQAVLRDGMDQDTQRLWAERALRAVNRAFPDVEPQFKPQHWDSCQRCLPHIQMCATCVVEYGLAFPEAACLLNRAGSYLLERARYKQAELLLLQALEVHQKIWEVPHPDTACTLNDLGELYLEESKYSKAETRLQEALEIRQQVLGTEHPDVAQTLHNLANLYRAQGDYDKAEPRYLKAMNIRETTPGIDPARIAESYYGLAKLYNSQEKYQQAETLCKQALHIQKQLSGGNDPRIASTLNMLAKSCQGQSKLDQAEELNMRALQIRENTSGSDHPHMAAIINSLVEIYHAQGRVSEAELLISRSLKIHEQSLGWGHPFMAYSLNNLAENFFLQGNYVQAEIYYKKALSIREHTLSCDHPRTATSYNYLARLYFALERYEEAQSFYLKMLSIRERVFGIDHPAFARTREQYAALLKKLRKES